MFVARERLLFCKIFTFFFYSNPEDCSVNNSNSTKYKTKYKEIMYTTKGKSIRVERTVRGTVRLFGSEKIKRSIGFYLLVHEERSSLDVFLMLTPKHTQPHTHAAYSWWPLPIVAQAQLLVCMVEITPVWQASWNETCCIPQRALSSLKLLLWNMLCAWA